jgi:Ni,Fe-hydrogenase III large subunit/Ni,Fe-hydrogenase III component G
MTPGPQPGRQTLNEFIAASTLAARAAGWPRIEVSQEGWHAAIHGLTEGWALLGLWAEEATIHMAILDEDDRSTAIVSLPCPDGRYPSVSLRHPPALRLERAVRDLFGLEADGAPDVRPWLDHGRWGVIHPLGASAELRPDGLLAPPAYPFLSSTGAGLHQIAVGPVHAGIIEPGHFRFTVSGETVVRLEQRLGYTHKGIEGLMAGSSLPAAARLAARVSGDSTVAYSLAFAQATESALDLEPPQRSLWLRALMAELERLANHLGDVGAVCNDAAFALLHAHCAILREQVLRAAAAAFGHRLMRDRVVLGGVAADISGEGEAAIRSAIDAIARRFPGLVEVYEETASLQDRTVAAGILPPALARQYAAGGYVGRASGRAFDARRLPGHAPYDQLEFDVPVRDEGDVDARVWIRIHEIEQSMRIVGQVLAQLPAGPIAVPVPTGASCEGAALVEGFRGDVLVWVRLGADGKVQRCHLRDPSWFQWPLLEAAIAGNIVADFPLCNKSFNCAYSGHDL